VSTRQTVTAAAERDRPDMTGCGRRGRWPESEAPQPVECERRVRSKDYLKMGTTGSRSVIVFHLCGYCSFSKPYLSRLMRGATFTTDGTDGSH
jgi:hypothetical protein